MKNNITNILESINKNPYSMDFCKFDNYIIKFEQNIPILWFSLTDENEYFSLEKITYDKLNETRKIFGLSEIKNPVSILN
jgi:hypothetical protein